MSEEADFGDEAECRHCGKTIIYVGRRWEHRYDEYHSKHRAEPKPTRIIDKPFQKYVDDDFTIPQDSGEKT